MKRPWNLPDIPVYSLATYDEHVVNMNICTYVSAVSMNPKRYMVAVYHDTQTLVNLQKRNTCVLQLLSKHHIALVNMLGKKSGLTADKHLYLTKRKLLKEWSGQSILTDCAATIALNECWRKKAGDHTLFVFDVKKFVANHDEILMLSDLRAKKLIRI